MTTDDSTTDDSPQQARDLPAGLSVFDRNGKLLGVVSEEGVVGQYLMMTEGRLMQREVAVPISAIDRSDGVAVYLNRTKQEIEDLTLGGWSSLGDVDLDTGEPASGTTDATGGRSDSNEEDEKRGP